MQTTRHSNTMIFGTNTTVGFKVGQNVNQVPEIMLAYDRQEAVIMPLVANTGNHTAADGTELLQPCDMSTTVKTVSDKPYAVHPCSLVAWNGSAQDSYSVLASFGADFGGAAKAGSAESTAGIAQYFATGIAAQVLAARGGAALVSTGKAAELQHSDASVGALFGNVAAFERGVQQRESYDAFRVKLLQKIAQTADDQVMARIAAYDAVVPDRVELSRSCSDKASCIDLVANPTATIYLNSYALDGNSDIYQQKLDSWDSN
ncbi:MAG TPA: hypothetical protein VI168_03740 [Croceibacterium sp.]